MAVVTRIACQHLWWLDPPGNHKVVCFQLFPSEVSRRFDKVIVHIGGGDWWPQLYIINVKKTTVYTHVNGDRCSRI